MSFHTLIKHSVLIAATSMIAMGCASSKKETTTKTDAPDPNAPMEQTSVVSSDSTTTPLQETTEDVNALTAEYEMFNVDEVDPETKTVIVKENYPVAAIFFDFDVASLDEANMIGVERAHRWLEANPNKGLIVTGHADQQGSVPYNQELALERAQAAGKALLNKGVDSSRLVIVTHGEEHLKYIKPEYNRRVVFMTDPANAYGVNDTEPSGETTIRVTTMAQIDE